MKILFAVTVIFHSFIANAQETKVSHGADGKDYIFTRDTSIPELGEAWRDPDNLIWGDIVKNSDGTIRYFTEQSDAKNYCDQIYARLPNFRDFEKLREFMGYDYHQNEPNLYLPQVLPNLVKSKVDQYEDPSHYFWTSTFKADAPSMGRGCVFIGKSGEFIPEYPFGPYDQGDRHGIYKVATRCVYQVKSISPGLCSQATFDESLYNKVKDILKITFRSGDRLSQTVRTLDDEQTMLFTVFSKSNTESDLIEAESDQKLKDLGVTLKRASKAACLTYENPNLVKASRTGDLPRIKALLNAGADINQRSDMSFPGNAVYASNLTALMVAKDETIAKFLLENGADINANGVKGYWFYDGGSTALEIAFAGYTPNFRFLLNNGAKVEKDFLREAFTNTNKCSDGRAAGCVDEILLSGRYQKLMILIQHGAYPLTLDKQGKTKMFCHDAYKFKPDELLAEVLQYKDENGENWLFKVIEENNISSIETLLYAGFGDRMNALNNSNETVLDKALRLNLKEVAAYLVSKGAKKSRE